MLDLSLTRRTLLLSVAAVALLAFLSGLTGLRDEDTFHLLADGRELFRRGGASGTDPFLFPFAGAPYELAPHWLTSVAVYGSWLLGGDAGPAVLAACLLALLFALLAIDGLGGGGTRADAAWLLLPLALAAAVLRPRAVARPEMIANVLLALVMLLLRRHEQGHRWALLAIPAIVVVWTNAHGSALAGVAAVAILALAVAARRLLARRAGLEGAGIPSGRQVGVAALVAVASFAGAAAHLGDGSPVRNSATFVAAQFGRRADWDPAIAQVLPLMKRAIVELQPLTGSDWLGPFGALVALTAVTAGLSLRAGSARELATAAAFVALAIPTRRFAATAAVVLAPIAARNLAHAARRWLPRAPPAARVAPAVVAAGALLAAGLAFARDDLPFGTELVERKFPVRAASYLRSAGLEGRVFNSFHLGGYLEWTLDRPVFQDGRGKLRPGDEAAAFAGPSHGAAFDRLDGRYRFDALVLAYPEDVAGVRAALSTSAPGADWAAPRERWALVAFDEGGLLYLRRDGAHAHRIAADEYRHVFPANDFPLERLGSGPWAEGFRRDLERAVREAPSCLGCRKWLGMALIHAGRRDEAAEVLQGQLGEAEAELRARAEEAPSRQVGGDPLHREGRSLAEAGRLPEAAAVLRRAWAARPSDAVRLDLAYVLVQAGEAREGLEHAEALVARAPARADARLVQGLALERLGDRGRAAAAFREVLRLSPGGGEAAIAAERLRALEAAAGAR